MQEHDVARLADLLAQGAVLKRARELHFVHPIVREAIYLDLAPRARADAHARAAQSLAAAGASPERIAAQLLGTEPAGATWTIQPLRAAARQATAKGAVEVAVRYLRRALAEPPEAQLRPRLLLELGSACVAAGEQDAVAVLEEALALATDVEVQARVTLELGTAMLYGGQPAQAVRVVEHTLERLGDSETEHRPTLELLLLMHAHSTTTARELVAHRLRRAANAVERPGEHAPELLATVALNNADGSGTGDQATRLAVRALEGEHLLEGSAAESAGFYFATCALTLADRGDVCEPYFDRALEIARSAGSARAFASASCCRGWTRYRRGDLLGAEADLRGALDLALEFATVLYQLGLGALIKLQLDQGDHAGAAASVEGAALARCDPDSQLFQEFRGARARWHLAAGRPAAALDDALAIARWARRWGARADPWARWRPLAALAYAALGDTERAAATAHEAVERAREFGAADYLGMALRTAAGVVKREREIELLQERCRCSQAHRLGSSSRARWSTSGRRCGAPIADRRHARPCATACSWPADAMRRRSPSVQPQSSRPRVRARGDRC